MLSRNHDLLENGAFWYENIFSSPANYVLDEADEYYFDGEVVDMYKWNELTREYFEKSTDKMAWITIFEEIN